MAMVDRLVFIDTPAAFRTGKMKDLVLVNDEPARITLNNKPQKGYPRDGTWTSPQLTSDFPFTELLPSWNLITPPDTGVVFHVAHARRGNARMVAVAAHRVMGTGG